MTELKPYHYFVSFSYKTEFRELAIGNTEVDTERPVNQIFHLHELEEYIEVNNGYNCVIIINFILFKKVVKGRAKQNE